MKIGFLITDYTVGRGSERVAATLANALSSTHDIHVLSLYKADETPFFAISDQVNVHVLTPVNDRGLSVPSPHLLTRKAAELLGLRKFLAAHRFTILVGVSSYPSILLGLIKRVTGNPTPMSAWEHSNYHALSATWQRIRRIAYRQLDAVVCLTGDDERLFAAEGRRAVTIPNLISFMTADKSPLTAKKILAVGALEEEKGFDLLLAAFQKISAVHPEWTLLLIGAGSKRSALAQLVVDYGLSGRVEMKPPVRDIRQEMLASSIYVLSSHREGFGMVLLEAMECGLAAVSFDCPTGPRNIIRPGENGLLVPPGDVEGLAEAVSSLIQHPDRLRELALGGIQSAKAYYPEHITARWTHFFHQLTGRGTHV